MTKTHTGDPRGQARRTMMWAVIAALLLLPLAAMQLTDEVTWTPGDFAFAAILLGGAGAAYELASWRCRDSRRRGIVAALIICAVALIWAEAAVGLWR